MYTNSNNRIITKYTEFLQQQNEQTLEPLKRVNSTIFSASADEHEILSDSSSGDENGNANLHRNGNFSAKTVVSAPRAKKIISAEVHQTDDEHRVEVPENPEPLVPATLDPDPIPFPSTTELKFSDIFTPTESHALFQRSLFLKSEAGRFLAEANAAYAANVKSKSDSDLVVLASKISSRASADGISRGPPESGDDDYPVRPLNPHPNHGNYSASSSLADLTSMSMRRELLNNIRAISRATFFENLYAGTVAPNPEPPKTKLSNGRLDRDLRPQTVVSERGELLVFEKQAPDSPDSPEIPVFEELSNHSGNQATDSMNMPEYERRTPKSTDFTALEKRSTKSMNMPEFESQTPKSMNTSEFERQTPKSKDMPEFEKRTPKATDFPAFEYRSPKSPDLLAFENRAASPEKSVLESKSPDSASKRESIDLWIKNSQENLSVSYAVHEHEPEIEAKIPEETKFSAHDLNNLISAKNRASNPNTNSSLTNQLLPDNDILEYVQQNEYALSEKHEHDPVEQNSEHVTDILVIAGSIDEPPEPELDNIPDVGPNFLSKTDSSDSNALFPDEPRTPPKFQPIFNRIESPILEPVHSATRNRQNTPKKSFLSNILKPVHLTNGFSKQVRYPSVLPKRSPILYDRRSRRVGKLPGILRRQNMDQWVAKIVWFYINGDEHFPKFEYRFRPGRDVRSWDGLCDILSNRLKLARGVRFIFTTSGIPVNSVDDLQHSGSYVVSSVRKFKALNYGGELLSGEDDELDDLKRRPPSAPTQRKPPIIRIRRERSLNGVSWGSPQQQLSGSETNNNNTNVQGLNGARPSLSTSALEAERVLTEVIGQARPVEKRVVRIINGQDPSIQSQVLLNTKVSQEWVDLVKDLGLAVKIPRRLDCRMETLTGRQIQSYSQLRSELKAGNQAFYIYNTVQLNSRKNFRTGTSVNDLSSGIPLHFQSSNSLNKIKNTPTSNSNPALATRRPSRRRGTFDTSGSNLLQVGVTNGQGQDYLGSKKSVSSSSIFQPTESSMRKSKSLNLSNNTLISPASSHPNLTGNLQQRRRSTRRRSQASTYLAHRSRSPTPEYN